MSTSRLETFIWPSYVAYGVSFLTIGIIWVQHHTFMTQIERTIAPSCSCRSASSCAWRSSRFLPGSAPSTSGKRARGLQRSYLPGPWIYLVSTIVAVVHPTAGVALFAAIAIFYVAESSLFGRNESPS